MLDLDRELRVYAEHIDVPPVSATEAMRTRPTRTHLHPVLVAAAAAFIMLLAIGGFALLVGHTDRPVVNSTTTLPTPTTTLAPTTTTVPTTTTIPTTTTAEAAASIPVISWSRVDDPLLTGGGAEFPESVSVVNGVLYVTGANWADEANADAVIWRSENGITWERFDDPAIFGGPGAQNIFGVVSHNSTTVAVGLDCTDDESACLAAVWTSEDDGHTWKRLPHQEAFGSEGAHRMLAVRSTDDGFIAVGDGAWISPDGYTWTEVMHLTGSDTMWDVVATPELIVGVGQSWENGSETAIWTSPDGISWTRISDEDGDFEAGQGKVSWLKGVTATERGFIAVGQAGSGAEGPVDFDAVAWRSADGHTWHKLPALLSGPRSEVAEGVAQVDRWVVAVGGLYFGPHTEGPGFVWASSDNGLSWTQIPNTDRIFGWWTGGYTNMAGVAELDGRVVIAGVAPHVGVAVWIGMFGSS